MPWPTLQWRDALVPISSKHSQHFLKKVFVNARLLRSDPERLAKNLLQFTNPALFEQRLLDVLHASPMHVQYSPSAARMLRLNVLDAAWSAMGMTGGPNTAVNLAFRVARNGLPVRLVSTVEAATIDPGWLHDHAESLLGGGSVPNIQVASAAQAGPPLQLGPGDAFLATHWTTAQQLKAVLPNMSCRQFFYMLQEFEPGFYPWSSNFALAVETYGMDYWPIINQATLANYLLAQPFGRLNDPVMRDRAIIFEPAVDAALFHPGAAGASPRPRRLLFYARPTNTRNLFGLGLLALRQAAADPAFAGWEFLSIGSRGSVPDLPLGHGHTLRRAPWMDYAGYGDVLRGADILLCPMLSPHTSYPVLEMAACGGLSVTTIFATKTQEALAAMSENIIAVEPTVEAMAHGLIQGACRANSGQGGPAATTLPCDWNTALDPVADRVASILKAWVANGSTMRQNGTV